jgi:hypothetical protein
MACACFSTDIESYIKYQNLKKDAVYYSYIKKISISCDVRIENKEIKEGANDKNKLFVINFINSIAEMM